MARPPASAASSATSARWARPAAMKPKGRRSLSSSRAALETVDVVEWDSQPEQGGQRL